MPASTGFDKDKIKRRLITQTEYLDDHWIFTGGSITTDGHRRITIKGRRFSVPKLSLYIHKDFNLGSSMQANHIEHCPHKNCWNPEHIYVGTHEENMTDQSTKREHVNLKKNVCKHGHPEDGSYYSFSRHKSFRYCKTCAKIKDSKRRR